MRRLLILIAIILLLGGGYAALSHQFGLRTERTLAENAEALSELGIEATFKDYRRGVFRSRFRLHLDYEGLIEKRFSSSEFLAADIPTSLDIPVTLRHGPLVFAETGIPGLAALSADLTDLIEKALGDSDIPADLRLSVRLTAGGVDGRASLGELDFQWKEGGDRLTSSPIRLDFGADSRFQAFSSRLEWDSLLLGMGEGALSIGPGRFESEMSRAGDFLWFGSQTGALQTMLFAKPEAGEPPFSTGTLRYEAVTGPEPEDESVIFWRTGYALEGVRITMPGKPAFTGDFILNMETRHVSRHGYEALMASLAGLDDFSANPEDPEAAAASFDMIRAPLNAILAESPVIEVAPLGFAGSDGSAEVRLSLTPVAGPEISAGAWSEFAGLLAGEGRIDIDKGLLRAIVRNFMASVSSDETAVEDMLGNLLQQLTISGMFRAEGDQIRSALRLADGVFSMNEVPVFDANSLFAGLKAADPEPE